MSFHETIRQILTNPTVLAVWVALVAVSLGVLVWDSRRTTRNSEAS